MSPKKRLGAAIAVTAILFAASAVSPPRAFAHCNEPQGFHEYAIFGSGPFYLYHFPAFGSIHAYEVLEEVALLGKDGSDAYWVLPDYSKSSAHFTARLHYRNDQGQDTDVIKPVMVVVKTVAVNQILKTPFVRPAHLTYTYVGTRDAGYLIHKLVWDPDFNQIIKVKPVAAAESCLVRGATEVVVDGVLEGESNRLKAGTAGIAATVCGQSVQLSTEEQLFEFTADLEH